jgi:hypothetical protein
VAAGIVTDQDGSEPGRAAAGGGQLGHALGQFTADVGGGRLAVEQQCVHQQCPFPFKSVLYAGSGPHLDARTSLLISG